jgi:predicted GIY-YIG superfamily endonuclease
METSTVRLQCGYKGLQKKDRKSRWVTIPDRRLVYQTRGGKIYVMNTIPNLPGVYVLYFLYRKIYIGSSNNLRKRISSHTTGQFKTRWNMEDLLRLKYQVCPKLGHNLMLEARLIKRIKPFLNKRGK